MFQFCNVPSSSSGLPLHNPLNHASMGTLQLDFEQLCHEYSEIRNHCEKLEEDHVLIKSNLIQTEEALQVMTYGR